MGIILHEYVGDKFRLGEDADAPNSPYNTVKSRLVNLNNQFASKLVLCYHVQSVYYMRS